MVRRYQITRAGVITLALLLCLTACQTSEDSTSTASMTSLSSTVSTSVVNSEAESTVPTLDSLIQYDNNDTNTAYDRENCTVVSLNGADGSVSGGGASFSGSTLTISKAGDYLLEGVLYGSVIVDAPKEAVVRLILNGVQIQNGDGPAIRINQCDKTVLILADESDNTLSDTKNYTLDADSDEPDATLFSKDDLTILGGGSLTINASYKDAIKGKDDLLLLGGNLTLTAADDGITGRDLLVIDGASGIDPSLWRRPENHQ